MTNDQTVTQAAFDQAASETERLQRELDITNADHVALWIAANLIPDEPMSQCVSWFACRIVEAYERTAHSGEGRGHFLSRYVQHLPACKLKMRMGGRCDCGLAELRHPSEGRSNGAGEDAVIQGLWLDILEKDDRTSPEEYPDMALITEDEFAGSIRYALAALSAPQGEVERGTLPRLDEGLIIAAMRGHYGSKADSIDGLDLTADDVNWSFRDGFTRMWDGVRKELKRRAALAQPEAGGEHE